MEQKISRPVAIFDSLEFLNNDIDVCHYKNLNFQDYKITKDFLKSYYGSIGTFNSYRREVERIMQWLCLIKVKNFKQVKREDIEQYLKFCQNPPKTWIGVNKVPRFITKSGQRVPNPNWKPFVVTISKLERKNGKLPTKADFALSSGAMQEILAILSSFFNFLLQEEYVLANPIALIRQKSKIIRKNNNLQIRRLSTTQWSYVLETAKELAAKNPTKHERTLFIMSILFSLYLRISELCASKRWSPTMNDFSKDNNENWWFYTVGKGNKARQIAVSASMQAALVRWRKFLGLTKLPTKTDNSPLLPKIKGKGPITSTTYVRELVQSCFDTAIHKLRMDNLTEEAYNLSEATVHWLRHTGISEDVKHRPKEHVRDDAGHSSSAITDRYVDIELIERHKSAQAKTIEKDK